MSEQVKMHSLMVEKKVINTFQTVFRRITSILTVLSPTLVSRIKEKTKLTNEMLSCETTITETLLPNETPSTEML